jgi:hypothetical protein
VKQISEHIEEKFYKVLMHKIGIQDFEKWVYATSELETELEEDVYIEIVSLNYKSKFAHDELEKIVGCFIDKGKFEKKIKRFIESIINRDENCAESIEMTYELYCSGYTFLRRLGLTYVLLVAFPPAGNYQKAWNEISLQEQNDLLDKFYPSIILDAKNVLRWIENRKIIIRNSVDELGNYEYDDFRNQEEINQGDIEVIDLDKEK